MWILLRQALVSFLVYLLPMDVIARMLIVLLRKIAKWTKNTTDDELVAVLAKKFDVEEVKDEPSSRE